MAAPNVSDVKVEDVLEFIEAGHDDRPRFPHRMLITVGVPKGPLHPAKLATPYAASFPRARSRDDVWWRRGLHRSNLT